MFEKCEPGRVCSSMSTHVNNFFSDAYEKQRCEALSDLMECLRDINNGFICDIKNKIWMRKTLVLL